MSSNLPKRLEELYNSAWVEGSNWKRNNPENSPIPSEKEIKKTNQALTAIEQDILTEVIGEDEPHIMLDEEISSDRCDYLKGLGECNCPAGERNQLRQELRTKLHKYIRGDV